MKTIATICLSLCALPSALHAQAKIIATPVGLKLETTEGDDQLARGWHAGRTLYFGGYANARYQYLDDELTDSKVRVLRSIGFRHDYTRYSASSGMGRRWSKVEVTISQLDYKSFSTSFAKNLASPTKVFSGAVAWPNMTGLPASKPAPLVSALTTPFASVYIHTGKKAILSDWKHSGGTLMAGAWGTSRKSYYLDGLFCADNMFTGANVYPKDNGCNDSAVTAATGARMYSGYNQFSKAHQTRPHTIEIPIYSRYTAPNAAVIHAIGIKGSTVGVSIGAGCNNLLLDFTLPVFLIPATAGGLPNAQTPRINLKGPRSAINLKAELWAQGAWSDTRTKRFSLTRATRARAPNLGMTDVPPRKRMVYRYNSLTATTGTITRETWSYNHPITFYGL